MYPIGSGKRSGAPKSDSSRRMAGAVLLARQLKRPLEVPPLMYSLAAFLRCQAERIADTGRRAVAALGGLVVSWCRSRQGVLGALYSIGRIIVISVAHARTTSSVDRAEAAIDDWRPSCRLRLVLQRPVAVLLPKPNRSRSPLACLGSNRGRKRCCDVSC